MDNLIIQSKISSRILVLRAMQVILDKKLILLYQPVKKNYKIFSSSLQYKKLQKALVKLLVHSNIVNPKIIGFVK